MTYEQLRDITNRRNNLDLAKECEYLERTSPRETSNTGTCTLTLNERQGAPGGGEALTEQTYE